MRYTDVKSHDECNVNQRRLREDNPLKMLIGAIVTQTVWLLLFIMIIYVGITAHVHRIHMPVLNANEYFMSEWQRYEVQSVYSLM